MYVDDLNAKISSLSNGLEVLGGLLIKVRELNHFETEQMGCLLLCLAEYAKTLED